MAVGPPVQDFWMLLRGSAQDSLLEIDLFLEGYETFMNFDRHSLSLIEPLRAMRYIHYIAWCAHQVSEEGESRAVTNFGTHEYWQQEMDDLANQLERIRKAPRQIGNIL
jgi:Ser/Thr protein kinase RdoA (MazF antagonist)